MNASHDNESAFRGLKPAAVWNHFAHMVQIPRPSTQESQIIEYVRGWAHANAREWKQDAAGNLVVYVPGNTGRQAADVLVLQSHVDMVCERKPDSLYDPEQGRILVSRSGDWIVAPETTLGADNGIGIATMLWLGEDRSIPHGPLDLLFTVDEETGMTGAANLDSTLIRGRTLINLDSEDDSTLFIGCAGGANTRFLWKGAREPVPTHWHGTYVRVDGLQGGHSGVDIDKNRLNAIKFLVSILRATDCPLMLSHFDGGNKSNAIPRDASATVFHAAEDTETIRGQFSHAAEALSAIYRSREGALHFAVADAPRSIAKTLPESYTRRVLDVLSALPSGVLAMSADLPGIVETSTNLATVRTLDASDGQVHVEIVCSSRSSVPSALRSALDAQFALARLAGITLEESKHYPGWMPNTRSTLLDIARNEYQRLFSAAPAVTAIHAGLECGLLGTQIPFDMISIGPTIQGAHAPGERVSIPSVEKFCGLLTALLDRFSGSF